MSFIQPERNFRLFVLGAGFSKPAGFPNGIELWKEIRRRAESLVGRAEQFQQDLEAYLRYRRDCDRISQHPDDVDFEEFLAFLDVEHHLGLRGSDTWSVDGNEAQVVVKYLIGEILAERMESLREIPELYLRFAASLKPQDVVLTFNYDPLLERALEAVENPYRLFPDRFRVVREFSGEIDDSHAEVVVLKLHGSIDWFDRSQHDALESHWRREGATGSPYHPVFNRAAELNVSPLLEGPRFPNDPLQTMYRVGRVEELYGSRFLFSATPWLLNPSAAKMLYSNTVRDFWHGLGVAGGGHYSLGIVGFSLPPHDEYARQAIYRIVKNYQSAFWLDGIGGRRKAPLALVDYRTSDESRVALEERYGFVDWSRAEKRLSGFDDTTIELLFPRAVLVD